RGGDRRWVELELGHRDLDGPGGLPSAATATAGCDRDEGQEADGGKEHGASHQTAVTARERIPNRKIQTTSTKWQYRGAAAKPTGCWPLNCRLAARPSIGVRKIRPPATWAP